MSLQTPRWRTNVFVISGVSKTRGAAKGIIVVLIVA
jgi:hypothetical protein